MPTKHSRNVNNKIGHVSWYISTQNNSLMQSCISSCFCNRYPSSKFLPQKNELSNGHIYMPCVPNLLQNVHLSDSKKFRLSSVGKKTLRIDRTTKHHVLNEPRELQLSPKHFQPIAKTKINQRLFPPTTKKEEADPKTRRIFSNLCNLSKEALRRRREINQSKYKVTTKNKEQIITTAHHPLPAAITTTIATVFTNPCSKRVKENSDQIIIFACLSSCKISTQLCTFPTVVIHIGIYTGSRKN